MDVAAGAVLAPREARALFRGDDTVALGLGFRRLDAALLRLEAHGFLGRELAGRNTLLDALLLARFALVDARGGRGIGAGLRERGSGGGQRENDDEALLLHGMAPGCGCRSERGVHSSTTPEAPRSVTHARQIFVNRE